jgi:hypothetical protein
MATCEQCGNDYENAFVITMNGESHTFDSFECAIGLLAPTCRQCGNRIIGHGIEATGHIYCCAHCTRLDGISDAVDHVRT